MYGKEEMAKFTNDIGEFSTIKEFMETNSEMVKHGNSAIKSIDCKVVSVLLDEVTRYASISKVQDDNYVFIRRAMDVKGRVNARKSKKQKEQIGSEVAHYVDVKVN